MEAFIPYVVPLLVILLPPLSVFLLSFLRKTGSRNLPPGSKGWPILGENTALALLGTQKFVQDRMARHSPELFRTSLLGDEMAIFCGARGNKFLFMNDNKLVARWSPKSLSKALTFPDILQSISPAQASALRRSFGNDFLKPEALREYIPVMDAMARAQMDSHWIPNTVVKVLPLSKKYTFELACKIFMDVVDSDCVTKLLDPFGLVTEGMFSVPIDLPGTAYNRAIKGGRLVREELMRIILERRMTLVGGPRDDLLSRMVMVRDGDGQFLNEMAICNNIIGLLVASFDTTSSAITGVLNYLAQLPHVYSLVLKEQMEIAKSKGPDELLTWEDIDKMKYSWNVARESLRLVPPAIGGFREAATEFTYAGFTIPKGCKTLWTVHSSHKNPEYFPEPEKFDPSRFEGRGPAPYTFVPFGGGPRMCPGKEYARLEVLVFMHNVVKRFKLEKAIPYERIVFHASSSTPAHGLPVHLHPHDK